MMSKKNFLLFSLSSALIFTVLISSVSFGRTSGKGDKKKENQIKSLVMGINSSNSGLAQSSIYLAGYYQLPWAVETLINVLTDDSRESYTRILAAYSLRMIGDKKGLEAIKSVSESDSNSQVLRMCQLIYKNYLDEKSGTVADNL
jgi:HEAT repeat protein